MWVAAALAGLVEREESRTSDDPFETLADWRLGGPAWVDHRLVVGDHPPVALAVRGHSAAADVRRSDGSLVHASAELVGDELVVRIEDGETVWAHAVDPSEASAGWGARGRPGRSGRRRPTWRAARRPPTGPDRCSPRCRGRSPRSTSRSVSEVVGGQPVVAVEAMKMEHVVRAAGPGVVAELGVRRGDQVALDQVVAVLAPLATG